jgi:hypothetical protein
MSRLSYVSHMDSEGRPRELYRTRTPAQVARWDHLYHLLCCHEQQQAEQTKEQTA